MQTTLTSTRSYGAFGETRIAGGNARSAYAGEVGEADLPWYLLGNRFYIPSLRQFVSPDRASPFDAGGLNRYAYCGGDPINRIDPTGESFWDYLGAALGMVGAAIGVAATGGALLGVLGAAAAAGSLTAAVSTTSMVTMTVATVLEAVSVVAEIGSVASLAASDEKAAGIFGWVAFGAGVGAGGVSVLAKRTAKSSLRYAAPRSGERAGLVPVEVNRIGNGTRSVFQHGYLNVRRDVVLHEGYDAVQSAYPNRVRMDGHRPYVEVQWYKARNMAGGGQLRSRCDSQCTRNQETPLENWSQAGRPARSGAERNSRKRQGRQLVRPIEKIFQKR